MTLEAELKDVLQEFLRRHGEVKATRFRDERQLVYVIDETKRQAVLDYLALKREEAARL